MTREEWLANLKPGDAVEVEIDQFPRGEHVRGAVKAVTRAHGGTIVVTYCGRDVKFNACGVERKGRGRYYRWDRLVQPSREIADERDRKRLIDLLASVRWIEMDLGTLRAVWGVIPEQKRGT